ncbi:MAG TPA: hypothetical protein VGW38_23900 [Chloroflexota bacterium]|nr:hypothetical protein [Chloroflexota bacterium]
MFAEWEGQPVIVATAVSVGAGWMLLAPGVFGPVPGVGVAPGAGLDIAPGVVPGIQRNRPGFIEPGFNQPGFVQPAVPQFGTGDATQADVTQQPEFRQPGQQQFPRQPPMQSGQQSGQQGQQQQQQQQQQQPAQLQGTLSPEQIAQSAQTLTNRQVTVQGEVTDVITANAFTIGGEVLVVTSQPFPQQVQRTLRDALRQQNQVRVSGTVRTFTNRSALERELGIQLRGRAFDDWTGRPVIIASSVEKV